jgi:hypothetical protein
MESVLNDSTRDAIALKRFLLISPVLNAQVSNQKLYFKELSRKVHDMPYYRPRKYTAKTIKNWLDNYRRGGIEALRPGYRKDRGRRRKIDEETAERIRKKRSENPRIPVTVLYEVMAESGELDTNKVSLQTFYRFLQAEAIKPPIDNLVQESPEMLRY